MDNQVTLSVVVLSYNNEQYIVDCLSSLERQNINSYEVFVIDDSSTDHSVAVIEDFIKDRPQFTLVQKENSGGAISSQIGIQMAKGKYCAIIDSDDIVADNAYNILIARIEKDGSDFAAGLPIKLTSGFMFSYLPTPGENNIFSENRILSTEEERTDFSKQGFYWNAVYKTDFLKTNNIEMPSDLLIADRIFLYKAIMRAKKISVDTSIVYYWRKKANEEKASLTDRTAEYRMISERCDSFQSQLKLSIQEAKKYAKFNEKIWENSISRLYYPLYIIAQDEEQDRYREFVQACDRYRIFLMQYRGVFEHLIINSDIPLNVKFITERILAKKYKDLYIFIADGQTFLDLNIKKIEKNVMDAIIKNYSLLSVRDLICENDKQYMYIQVMDSMEKNNDFSVESVFINNRYFNQKKIVLEYDSIEKKIDISNLSPSTYILNTICSRNGKKEYCRIRTREELAVKKILNLEDRTIIFNPALSMLVIYKKNRFTILKDENRFYLGVNEKEEVKEVFFFNINGNNKVPLEQKGDFYIIDYTSLPKGTNILIYKNKEGLYTTLSKRECSNDILDENDLTSIINKGRVEVTVDS